jgi:hypothetical protein
MLNGYMSWLTSWRVRQPNLEMIWHPGHDSETKGALEWNASQVSEKSVSRTLGG